MRTRFLNNTQHQGIHGVYVQQCKLLEKTRFEVLKSSTDLQLHDCELQNSRPLMLKDFTETIRAVCGYDNNLSNDCSVRAERPHTTLTVQHSKLKH